MSLPAPNIEPTYTPLFEAMWVDHFPQAMRDKDASLGWPLKRYMSLVGNQMGEAALLADRLLYIPENLIDDVELAPKANDQIITPDQFIYDSPLWSPFNVDNGTGTIEEPNFDVFVGLNNYSDQATVLVSPYLEAGQYQFTFDYAAGLPTNGRVSLYVNGDQASSVAENPTYATGAILTAGPWTVDVDRGYVSLQFVFETSSQSDNTKRINVGKVRIHQTQRGNANSTSDLVNPQSADVAWLPFVAMFRGMQLTKGDIALLATDTTGKKTAQMRQRVTDAFSGIRAGTVGSMQAALRPYLSGTKHVTVFDHTAATGDLYGAGPFDIAIVTRTTETPAGIDVPGIIAAAKCKPAGIRINHRTYTASWTTIEAKRTSWGAGNYNTQWDDVRWDDIETTGLGN